ncbi:uncharacterized protein H6S33_007619 [Morchella sextelata]|uniref:uncharacterized protein n=1 Tax=Morchella sextelata TaxID=1174677 RepID=UPI001D03C44F|nr:uncharacterized protein H6S33_007619 [Morchella sextelata]KAH0603297.1 hypothetical protein H6S33_007619 [Morchella sextelata]
MASGYHLITLFLAFHLLSSFASYSIAFPVEPRDTLNNRCGPTLGALDTVELAVNQVMEDALVAHPQLQHQHSQHGHQLGEDPSLVPGYHELAVQLLKESDIRHTPRLLEILRLRGIKATFFITGNNLSKGQMDDRSTAWPSVISRAYNEGHQIASHTWDHRDLNTLTETERQYQMTRNEQAFLIGRYPTYMRAPFIQCNRECLRTMERLGYHVVVWDLNTDDYNNVTPELIQRSKDNVDTALEGLNSNYNSLLSIAHDIHDQTVNNLTDYQITAGYQRGYRYVTVGECLGDPQSNWYRTQ